MITCETNSVNEFWRNWLNPISISTSNVGIPWKPSLVLKIVTKQKDKRGQVGDVEHVGHDDTEAPNTTSVREDVVEVVKANRVARRDDTMADAKHGRTRRSTRSTRSTTRPGKPRTPNILGKPGNTVDGVKRLKRVVARTHDVECGEHGEV